MYFVKVVYFGFGLMVEENIGKLRKRIVRERDNSLRLIPENCNAYFF